MERTRFEKLALEHLDGLYRMAYQLTRHPDDASDIVQETFLRALRAAERFEEQGGGIRPWLFKILHNVFYSHLERNRRSPTLTDGLPESESTGPGPDEAIPAWDLASLDWEQVDGKLKAAIDSLKPEYRSALLLWGVEELKYREIAFIQDVPIGTVMSRLHRARRLVAEHLAVMSEEKGPKEG